MGLRFRFNRWLFLPLAIIPIFVLLAIAISLLFPGTRIELNPVEAMRNLLPPEQFAASLPQLENTPAVLFYGSQIVSAIIAGYTVNALFAFGEEVGWRGYLLNTLKGKPFWKACVFIGAVWGIWHAPLILLGHNYPEHPQIGVVMMMLFCIFITPLHIYIRVKTKSIYGASILHGFLNALAGMPLLIIVGGNDLTIGATGAAGMIALVIMNVGLYVFDVHVTRDRVLVSDIS